MNFKDIFKKFKEKFLKFWRSDSGKISLIRDILIALIVVLIILTALWAYTDQWFSTPMVAIESGSMMHPEEPFGRLGTIDPGDMVLLVKVNKESDIVTYGAAKAQGKKGLKTYEDYGDVIVYRKYGDPNDEQIIHRAMCWIKYNEEYETYTVEEYEVINETSVNITELGLNNYKPRHSGFITKGDNPFTNSECDQIGGVCDEPIKPEWISGKARGELPWIGTINLFFSDLMSGSFWDEEKEVTVNNVETDCLICLILLIALLISIPIMLDLYSYYRGKKEQ